MSWFQENAPAQDGSQLIDYNDPQNFGGRGPSDTGGYLLSNDGSAPWSNAPGAGTGGRSTSDLEGTVYNPAVDKWSGAATTQPVQGFDYSTAQMPQQSDLSVDPNQGLLTEGFGAYQSPGSFIPPNIIDDPGYQNALDAASRARQTSAAAKGTLLTGGTQKDLQNDAVKTAMQYYGQAYDHAATTYGLNRSGSLSDYTTNQNNFNTNRNTTFGQNYNLAQLGLQATSYGNQDLGQYGTNYSNLTTGQGQTTAGILTGQGNAQAQNAVTHGNLNAQIPGQIAGVANAGLATYYNRQPNAGGGGYTPTSYLAPDTSYGNPWQQPSGGRY